MKDPLSEIENSIFSYTEFVFQTSYKAETGLTSKVLSLLNGISVLLKKNTRPQLPYHLKNWLWQFSESGKQFLNHKST